MTARFKSTLLAFVLYQNLLGRLISSEGLQKQQIIHHLNSLQDLDYNLNQYQSFLLTSYDPASCLHSFGYLKRLLNALANQAFMRDYKIGIGLINVQAFVAPPLGKNKSLTTGLALIQKSQTHIFEDFRDLIERGRPYKSYHAKVLDKTLEFLSQFVHRVQPAESWDFLYEELKKHHRIGLFFSSDESDVLSMFIDFARRNGDAALYHTKNERLVYEILGRFKVFLDRPLTNGFIVIHWDQISKETTPVKLDLLQKVDSFQQLQQFWTISRYSSIIRDISWQDLTEAVRDLQ